jgi:iron complex outermembrane receptor protein
MDRELSSSPRHLGKLNVTVPLYKDRLFSSIEMQYQSSVRTVREIPLDGFFVTNLSLFNAHVIEGLELSLSLYNAFDAKNGYEGGADHLQNMIPQDGRTVRGKVAYRF